MSEPDQNALTKEPTPPVERAASARNPAGAAASSPRTPPPVAGDSEHLRLLIESATDYALFSMDAERRVNTWNTGAQRMFGYAADEILGKTGDIIFTQEDRARGAPQEEAGTARARGRAEDERWHVRKSGDRFYASGVMTAVRDANGELLGFFKIARDLTERKLAEDRLRAAREELEERVRQRTAELHASNEALRAEIAQRQDAEAARQELLRRIATAQEDERLRISRELHDEIGQHLAALMLGLNALERDVAPSAGEAVLPKLQELTEIIGREVHALAVQLRPAALDDLGLSRAISTYVDMWSARSGVRVELHVGNIDEPRLPADIELALYRIVQEALTNVLKHAGASRVSVILNRPDGEVVGIIEDNGKGFDAEATANSAKGLGLVGMRERAAQFGGRVTVEAEPGQGTTVFVRLPIR